MAEASVQTIVDKQVRNTSGAIEDFRNGVSRVEQSPTAEAAKHLNRAKANFAKAVDSGKMAQRLQSVTLGQWQEATSAGADRIASGIERARGKLANFHEQRQAVQGRIDRTLSGIQKMSLQDSIRRMTTQVTEMAKFQPEL